jgi:hypothetical protein
MWNLFSGKPSNGLDQLEARKANLARRAAELAFAQKEMSNAEAEANVAARKFDESRAAHQTNINDPLRHAQLTLADIEASAKQLRVAETERDSADQKLSAVSDRVGDLRARQKQISAERAVLTQEEAREADRERKANILSWAYHGLELLRDDTREVAAAWRTQPKDVVLGHDLILLGGAGLIAAEPAAVATPVDDSGRTLLLDSIIRLCLVAYPELTTNLADLDENIAAEITRKIARDAARRATFRPGQIPWAPCPIPASGELSARRDHCRLSVNLSRGRIPAFVTTG